MTSMLSPQVSEESLSAALDAFRSALGPHAVHAGEDELREFRDPFAHTTWDDYTASAVLMPQTVEEIQQIVRIANEHKVPLWTHGTGMNNGYGGPAPRVKGSVIVSLRRMNRVLEINEEQRVCGRRARRPLVRPLRRDPGGRPQADALHPRPRLGQRCRQHPRERRHVPPDRGRHGGRRAAWRSCCRAARSCAPGMGAMPGNQAWHVYKRSLGPTPDQLFMQSNFGIVTKMGVWLMPYPECYMPLWLRVWNEDDLPALVETLRALMLDRTIENVPQIWNTIAFASVMSSRSLWYDGDDPDPGRDHRQDGARARGRPLDDALRPLRRRGGRRPPLPEGQGGVRADPRRGGLGREALARTRRRRSRTRTSASRQESPTSSINQMTGWYGGEEGGHIGFSPVAPLTGPRRGRAARPDPRPRRAAGTARLRGRPHPDQRAELHPCDADHLRHEERGRGAPRVRHEPSCSSARPRSTGTASTGPTSTSWISPPSSTASTTTPTCRFAETIKDALDPNGILSPGKQGIWPRALREARPHTDAGRP